MLLIIISDEPFVTEEYQRVDCDARCNFTINANPPAAFVSLEDKGQSNQVSHILAVSLRGLYNEF